MDYIAPAPAVSEAPAPVTEFFFPVPAVLPAPAPMVEFIEPSPVVSLSPVPVEEDSSPVPPVSHSPMPISPAPAVSPASASVVESGLPPWRRGIQGPVPPLVAELFALGEQHPLLPSRHGRQPVWPGAPSSGVEVKVQRAGRVLPEVRRVLQLVPFSLPALAVFCPRKAGWCANVVKAAAIDCCSCRHHERSRRCLRRWTAPVTGCQQGSILTGDTKKREILGIDAWWLWWWWF